MGTHFFLHQKIYHETAMLKKKINPNPNTNLKLTTISSLSIVCACFSLFNYPRRALRKRISNALRIVDIPRCTYDIFLVE